MPSGAKVDIMTPNEIKELADRLEQYNEWRRGENSVLQVSPTRIGLDLDAAVRLLRSLASFPDAVSKERGVKFARAHRGEF
jgi:hypothetical protein